MANKQLEHIARFFLRILDQQRVELRHERDLNGSEVPKIAQELFDAAARLENTIIESAPAADLNSGHSTLGLAIANGPGERRRYPARQRN